MNLRDKVCVVTGSAGGLGKEFAKCLLQGGGRVCISDVNQRLGEETLQDFQLSYGKENVYFVKCDVTKADEVRDLYQSAVKFFGSEVDVFVNNAGVMGEKEGWKLCMDINLYGVLNGCTTVFEYKKTGCTIVNVASILGLFCGHQPKGWSYNTSKTAVVTASRCMVAVDESVRIMCLCPSVTVTPILDGCSDEELQEMKKNVGGFMSPAKVGDVFINLLQDGKSGDVVALWKNTPPYLIPDTGMGLFIFYTVCAMMFRFWPKSATPNFVKPWPHIAICVIIMASFWVLIGTVTAATAMAYFG